MSYSQLILGTWNNLEQRDQTTGVTTDTYNDDGTKDMVVQFIKGGEVKEYTARSYWNIDGNVVTEEVFEVDKKLTQRFGIKKGKKLRAYIEKLDHAVFTFKNISQEVRAPKGSITLRKYNPNNSSDSLDRMLDRM